MLSFSVFTSHGKGQLCLVQRIWAKASLAVRASWTYSALGIALSVPQIQYSDMNMALLRAWRLSSMHEGEMILRHPAKGAEEQNAHSRPSQKILEGFCAALKLFSWVIPGKSGSLEVCTSWGAYLVKGVLSLHGYALSPSIWVFFWRDITTPKLLPKLVPQDPRAASGVLRRPLSFYTV